GDADLVLRLRARDRRPHAAVKTPRPPLPGGTPGLGAKRRIPAGGARAARLATTLGLHLSALTGPSLADPSLVVGSARCGNVVGREARVLTITVTADADTGFRGRLRVRAVDAYGASAGRLTAAVTLRAGGSVTRGFAIRARGLGYVAVSATLRRQGGRYDIAS